MKKNDKSFSKSFLENYKNNEGFKAFVKLTLYFIFIFVLIILITVLNVGNSTHEIKNTTTKTAKKVVVKDILEEIKSDNKSFKITAKLNNDTYIIEARNSNNVLTGTIEYTNVIKKFKIEDNKVYEITMNENKVNDTLFNDLEINYIIPANLVGILLKNTIIKSENNDKTELSYKINNTNIKVNIINYNVKNIIINDKSSNYLIEYN